MELNADPVAPGPRIPTSFCREDQSGSPPSFLDLDQADLNFIAILADDDLAAEDPWSDFVADQWEACIESSNRCVPFQLTRDAWPLDDRLRGVNFVRAFVEEAETRGAFVIRRLVTELCRYLHGDSVGDPSPEAPTKVFISHTKMDIEEKPGVVDRLKTCLGPDQPIKTWFDSGDIPGGSRFAEEIASGVQDSSLLCLLTNNYASREWCRKEILLAKEKQRPIVVIDALTRCEVRSFPYLGNLPVIRWREERPEAAVDMLLKETLRHLHDTTTLEKWKRPGDRIFTRAPELITLAHIPRPESVLYPDPPLGAEEARALTSTGVAVATPLERIAKVRSLKGMKIALSMSESTDIRRFGFDTMHLESSMLEISRYLLLKGATLVYGGHLGSEGYTQKLMELVRAHNQREGVDPVDRILNYIGWPLPLGNTLKARYKYEARLKRVSRPAGVDETLHADLVVEPASFFPGDRSAAHRYAWARGMTTMREIETRDAGARIVIGGTHGPTEKVQADGSRIESWYFGRIPGLLEEVLLSARAGQPVFLIGAFGGVASLVIDILEGRDRAEATWEYQKRAPYAREMRDLYKEQNETWWGYTEMVALLREKGVTGLNPLLREEDHRELFHTRDVGRMVQLIMKGLDKIPDK
ncbi:MAG: toll/interleukin-1 receptor domain-containing protein [Desulfobacterales bacterium]|nr:toll/interleukin-1 receptor domain-containing protein [Desulfobacterales bacterium]